ncbi:MAG: cation:proton antiporter [Thermoplasmata archaeon]|nr:MAG: cation:proton antiporter [Thermoplasmata archaeon]MCD6573734.1 cation:proton antiporter [Thermoplasmata archaeon]
MNPFMITLVLLSISILIAMIRAILGPTIPDRVVGLDTVNTLVIASMLVFGAAKKEVIYIDVAIVYALLSYITTVLIAKYLEGGRI